MKVFLSAESEAAALEAISSVGRLAVNPFKGMGSPAPSREEVAATARLAWEQSPKLRQAIPNVQAYVADQLLAAGYQTEAVPARFDWLNPSSKVAPPAQSVDPGAGLLSEVKAGSDWLSGVVSSAPTPEPRGLWGSALPTKKTPERTAAEFPWQPGERVGGTLGDQISNP